MPIDDFGFTVTGQVLNAAGAPAAGVEVTVLRGTTATDSEGNVPPPHPQRFGTTDWQGRFVLRSVTVGEPFSLEAEQYQPRMRAVLTDLTKAMAREPFTLRLAPTTTVTGRITAPGAPELGGTEVYLDGTSYWTMTEIDGAFSLSNVAPGRYRVIANRVGLGRAEVTAAPVAGQPLDVGTMDVRMLAPEAGRLFAPHAGPGVRIQMQGNHFSPRYDETIQVRFGEVEGIDVKVVHNRLLDVTVPAGARSGPVTVVVGGRSSDPNRAPRFSVVDKIELDPPQGLYPTHVFDVPTRVVDTEGVIVAERHANVTWRVEGDAVLLREGEPKFLAVKPGQVKIVARTGTVESSLDVTVPVTPE